MLSGTLIWLKTCNFLRGGYPFFLSIIFFSPKKSLSFGLDMETTIDYTPIIDILEEILGPIDKHNQYSGQISFSCPVCSYQIKGMDRLDGKGNLEVNYKMGVYKCWACAETHHTYGNIHKLIRLYGSYQQVKKFKLLYPDDNGGVEKKKYNPVQLPKEFQAIKYASGGLKLTHHFKRAYLYLQNRNVTDEMIDRYGIGFCYEGRYQNRIVIPSYDDNGMLNYFVSRSYENRPKKKYDNPIAEKDKIIFNEYLLDWDEMVYIVEGPFDHIFVPNSIPLLGKSLSDFLLNTIYDNAKMVTIMLDGDAYDDAILMYEKLNGGRLFGKIWIVKLPMDKDIADLRGNFMEYIPFQI